MPKQYSGDRGSNRPSRFWDTKDMIEREDAETLARYAAEQSQAAAFWSTFSVFLALLNGLGILLILWLKS